MLKYFKFYRCRMNLLLGEIVNLGVRLFYTH